MAANAFAAYSSEPDPFAQHWAELDDVLAAHAPQQGGEPIRTAEAPQAGARVMSDAGGPKAAASRGTIDLLRRQVEEMEIPPLPTPEQKAQIMKGRDKRGQAEIDAGRKAIQDMVDAHNTATTRRGELIDKLGKMEEGAGAADKSAEDKAYNDSWQGKIANKAANWGPSAAGAAGGYGYAAVTNKAVDAMTGGNDKNINAIGKTIERTDFSTPRGRAKAEGAVVAARNFRPDTAGKKVAVGASRAAVYGLPAAAAMYEAGNYRKQANDPALSEVERDDARATGNVFMGVGGGIAMDGARRAVLSEPGDTGASLARIEGAKAYLRDNPLPGPEDAMRTRGPRSLRGDTIDATATDVTPEALPPATKQAALPPPEAAVEPAAVTPPADAPDAKPPAETVEAKPAADTPEPEPKAKPEPHPASEKGLRKQAKALNIRGRSNMNKEDLGKAVGKALTEQSTQRLPRSPKGGKTATAIGGLLTGAMAYDAASSDAKAAGESDAEARGEGIVAGTQAAAPAVATGYALSRIPPVAARAAGVGLNVLSPMAASDITDVFANGGRGFTPEEIDASDNEKFNAAARRLPEWMMTGDVQRARDMAQVPERNAFRRGY